ncbi:MAG: alpha/beta fold hydrolase [Chloroflexota bacterium]
MMPNFADAFAGEEHQAFFWESQQIENPHEKAALLIHGFPGTPAEMRPVADILHAQGFAVRGVLLPGFGSEIEYLLERTHEDWLGSVGAALVELRRQYDTVIIAGYSMGGAIGINLAARHKVDGLVLFSPFVEINHMLWQALPVINVFLPTVKVFKLFEPDFSDPQMREGMLNFMPDADLDDPQVQADIKEFELPISLFNQIRMVGKKALQVAPQVTVSVQVFQGTEDDLVQVSSTQKLMKALGGKVSYHEAPLPHEIINPDAEAWDGIHERLVQYVDKITGAVGVRS